MCRAAKCAILNYWIFRLYEVKLEWGIWNQVLLEKQVCIALEWKQLYHYRTARSLFLQSFPFSFPFWSVAFCIINSPMVPLSRNISVLRLSQNTATYLFCLHDDKKLDFFERVKSSVLFLLWLKRIRLTWSVLWFVKALWSIIGWYIFKAV